ncbi:hypothetical protein IPA_04060 [Ignicoccus pacificus DSM 13166]|uniref:CopG family transcriptional regulator n=1 Tax=Ignicoccus pacificus DSM 13166 TaxID=940294 RepID=A0A977KC28_9CREN|nr:hypothetical protein IPA_04060 [Ignicoccus pacificus DSM 13166]
MTKVIMLKLPDDVYEELERRAKAEGYALVSDYVKELISRELGRAPVDLRAIQERLDKLESGSLPPRLYDALWNIVEEVLSSKLPELVGNLEEGAVDAESLSKIERKMERKMQDMIIPWTQKIDELAKKIADLTEELEKVKEELDELKEARKERSEAVERREFRREHREVQEERTEHVQRRFTAMDRLRQQGAVFEDELRTIRSKDYFFKKLERSGAIIVPTQRHGRVAVHPEAWEEFLQALRESKSGDEEEVLERLDKEALKKLFMALRSEGAIIFDSGSREWKLEVS